MTNYWISWYHRKEYGAFTLHSAWWVTGESVDDSYVTICAGIKADDETHAKSIIQDCFDTPTSSIKFRFVEERPDDWTPFNDRFKKKDWMKW